MRVFQELRFSGSKIQLEKAVEQIENRLADGWIRDRQQEESIASATPNKMYCFSCTGTESRETASLWLTYLDDSPLNTLYVPNIVPTNVRNLEVAQYNKIIHEFYVKFVKPTAAALDLESTLTSDTKDIQEWISLESATKLQQFARFANKNTGIGHPQDRAKWFDFVVATHTEPTTLDSEILARWLEETEGWPEEKAYDLSLEYEYSRSLLKAYDEQRA